MSERFELIFSREFLKKMGKLGKNEQIMILKGVKILETNPYVGKPLKGSLTGLYSLRQGSYREECLPDAGVSLATVYRSRTR